ncbi:NAD(P)/FAD-dependent oxidoreductase [Solwaraspora sp. WMMB335]|uniref:NAD(P)/FAD-dependent oxidoreductase n=1 Tax=Solwaraspora sp. WMMB335 TaxID=3404118 RepID=UPI003B951B98
MHADFVIVGAGIAGAVAGAHLAAHGRVLLLEMAGQPGVHSTGRSAALYSPYFGNHVVRALTRASRRFFVDPPAGFADHPLLTPRGVLTLCAAGAEPRFDAALADARAANLPAREIAPDEVAACCPVIRPGAYQRAMLKPDAWDIDVDALHSGLLRVVRAAGGQILRGSRAEVVRRVGHGWQVATCAGSYHTPVVVNAAGAWADEVAAAAGAAPAGCRPLRRTACVVDLPPSAHAADWPLINDVPETFYAKPESGGLLISPVDATEDPPGDARPDDLDVARGIAAVEAMTTMAIRRVRRAWAGHRTTTADDTPVVGPDPLLPGFAWLAGLGGYGVQAAPALGRLLSTLLTGGRLDDDLTVLADAVAPARLHRRP